MDPLSLGVGLGLATFATSLFGGFASNSAAKDYNKSVARAVGVQQKQLTYQAEQDISQTMDEGQAYRGRLRAAAADSGMGMAGTYKALMNNINFDEEQNISIIEQNLKNNIASVRSQGSATMQNGTPTWLTGLSGIISGTTAGLSLYGAGKSLQLTNAQLSKIG